MNNGYIEAFKLVEFEEFTPDISIEQVSEHKTLLTNVLKWTLIILVIGLIVFVIIQKIESNSIPSGLKDQ